MAGSVQFRPIKPTVQYEYTLDEVYDGERLERMMDLHRLVAETERGISPEQAGRLTPKDIRVVTTYPVVNKQNPLLCNEIME